MTTIKRNSDLQQPQGRRSCCFAMVIIIIIIIIAPGERAPRTKVGLNPGTSATITPYRPPSPSFPGLRCGGGQNPKKNSRRKQLSFSWLGRAILQRVPTRPSCHVTPEPIACILLSPTGRGRFTGQAGCPGSRTTGPRLHPGIEERAQGHVPPRVGPIPPPASSLFVPCSPPQAQQ